MALLKTCAGLLDLIYTNSVPRLRRGSWCRMCRYAYHHTSSSMIGSSGIIRPLLAQSSIISKRFVTQPSSSKHVLVPFASRQEVLQDVNQEIQVDTGRLFAIIQVSSKQFKVTAEDLIQFNAHIAADVGDRIVLQKVLLVGGDNFTVIGKPLVSPEVVRVEATVLEKTHSEKKILFRFRRRKNYKKYKEMWANQTILRINTIEMNPVLS